MLYNVRCWQPENGNGYIHDTPTFSLGFFYMTSSSSSTQALNLNISQQW